MNKFYEIDMPNLDNISIKTLMTNLSGVNWRSWIINK